MDYIHHGLKLLYVYAKQKKKKKKSTQQTEGKGLDEIYICIITISFAKLHRLYQGPGDDNKCELQRITCIASHNDISLSTRLCDKYADIVYLWCDMIDR